MPLSIVSRPLSSMLASSGTGAIFGICFNDQESGLLPAADNCTVYSPVPRKNLNAYSSSRFSSLGGMIAVCVGAGEDVGAADGAGVGEGAGEGEGVGEGLISGVDSGVGEGVGTVGS